MRKGGQDFNHLDVDRLPQPAVNRSSSDETVDPLGSNADGEHDASDVEGRCPRSRPPRRRGPKTAAGKARVSLNALTHGISSTRLVVSNESSSDWETYHREVVDALAPVGLVETTLAERVASAFWRLRRVTAYEEATLAERQRLETPSARLLPHPLDLDKICRYEAHLTRQLYQALHELEALRAARRGQAGPLLRVDVQGLAGPLIGTEAEHA